MALSKLKSRNAVDIELGTPSHPLGDAEHWRDGCDFIAVENRFRTSLDLSQLENKAFYSHCWRNHATQEKKRMIIAHLSHPPPTLRNEILQSLEPVVYWADFLDLQARGPVPWKMEITDGIRACSKFVAFIDFAWLTSYNCLQASLNNNHLSRITCIPITCIPPRCLGLSIFTACMVVRAYLVPRAGTKRDKSIQHVHTSRLSFPDFFDGILVLL